MKIDSKTEMLLVNIKIMQKQTDLPHLEGFKQYFNNDKGHMNLFWYLWFLDERYKKYRELVRKRCYTGSFSQFLDGK